jgi:hypothetical protein
MEVNWTLFRDMVGGLLSLTHLMIGVPFANPSLPNGCESTISLAGLLSLRIRVHSGNLYPDQLLLGISPPLLESLTLGGIYTLDMRFFCEGGAKLRKLDKFPYLRSLTFLHPDMFNISQETWVLFCHIFPHINHLAFDIRMQAISLEPFEEAMVSNTTTDMTKLLVLPKLHTLSFGEMRLFSVKFLSDLILMRAPRRPLMLVQLPEILLHSNQISESLDRLREYVELKEYQPRDWSIDTMVFE